RMTRLRSIPASRTSSMPRVAMSEGDLAQTSSGVAGEGRASPAEGEIAIDCRKLVKRFAGGSVVALDGVSLTIRANEFFTLLGPSGCGKTTLLRIVAGFETQDAGSVFVHGQALDGLPPFRRPVNTVFQSYAVFPHMTVDQNIAFGLEMQRRPRQEIGRRVGEMLRLVKLEGMGRRKPAQLSGGQQQRVALARALATSPRVLLMDEPLSALDLKLREAMRDEIQRIQRELRITTLLVTHDQNEAMSLSDRIILMGQGDIQQIGPPGELYAHPATQFVAEFIGKNNLLRASVVAQADGVAQARLPGGATVLLRTMRALAAGSEVEILVRPEALWIDADAPADAHTLRGTVERCRFLGNVTHFFVRAPWGQVLLIEVPGHAPATQPG